MKSTDKLTKKQVLSLPKLLPRKSIGEVAKNWEVSWQAVWYWVGQLRKRGIKVKTRQRGQTSLLKEIK